MAEFRLSWFGREVTEAVDRAALRGLAMVGEHLVGEAVRQVPLDEGTLMRSIRSDVDVATMSVAVSADTPYAERQHEDTSLQHPNGRKAKFISDPMEREREVCLGLLAAQYRRALS